MRKGIVNYISSSNDGSNSCEWLVIFPDAEMVAEIERCRKIVSTNMIESVKLDIMKVINCNINFIADWQIEPENSDFYIDITDKFEELAKTNVENYFVVEFTESEVEQIEELKATGITYSVEVGGIRTYPSIGTLRISMNTEHYFYNSDFIPTNFIEHHFSK